MKLTKKILGLAIALFGMVAFAQAQDTDLKFEKRAKAHHQKMIDKLGLNDEQAAAFKEIKKTYKEKAKALRTQTESKDELADLMYQNRKAKTAEIKQLLTPEQYAIFDKVDTDRKKRGKGKRGKKGKARKEF